MICKKSQTLIITCTVERDEELETLLFTDYMAALKGAIEHSPYNLELFDMDTIPLNELGTELSAKEQELVGDK